MKFWHVLLLLLLLVAFAVIAYVTFMQQPQITPPWQGEVTYTFGIAETQELSELGARVDDGSISPELLYRAVEQHSERYEPRDYETEFERYYDVISGRLALLDAVDWWSGSEAEGGFELTMADHEDLYALLEVQGRFELRFEADRELFGDLAPGETGDIRQRWLPGDWSLDLEANPPWHIDEDGRGWYLVEWWPIADLTNPVLGDVLGTPEISGAVATEEAIELTFDAGLLPALLAGFPERDLILALDDTVVRALAPDAPQRVAASDSDTLNTAWLPGYEWGLLQHVVGILERHLAYPGEVTILDVRSWGEGGIEEYPDDGNGELPEEIPPDFGDGDDDGNSYDEPPSDDPTTPEDADPNMPEDNGPGSIPPPDEVPPENGPTENTPDHGNH